MMKTEQVPMKPPAPLVPSEAASTSPSAALTSEEDKHDSILEDEEEGGDVFSVKAKPWDEGGISDCGYADTFHDTLLTVGEGVHGVVGEPSVEVEQAQTAIGNWFQELSYAVRDLLRGEKDVQEDAEDAIQTLINASSFGSAMAEDEKNDHNTATNGSATVTTSASQQ